MDEAINSMQLSDDNGMTQADFAQWFVASFPDVFPATHVCATSCT